MKNINTAANLAQLITSLPKALWSLPVFYEDCDCGKGLHEVNSLYPDRDEKGRIYLSPSTAHHQVTDILAEYNRLNAENEEIHKQVEKARAEGIEVQTHNEPPEGWDKCVLKTNTGRVVSRFDPHNENNANGIIEYFRDAIKKWYAGYSSDEDKLMNFLDVGYPGKRQRMPFILDKLDIQMVVDEMSVSTDEYSKDRYMYLKLHFKVQINWKPDLSNEYWKDIDVKYDHLDVYEFDDTLTLMLLPPRAEGEAATETITVRSVLEDCIKFSKRLKQGYGFERRKVEKIVANGDKALVEDTSAPENLRDIMQRFVVVFKDAMHTHVLFKTKIYDLANEAIEALKT